jgi:hypothetical protein
MAGYSKEVVANTTFFGERSREVVEQEIDRAKSLDTKAGAVVAASVALTGAFAVFVLNLAELEGAGSGARALWAVEIGAGLIALLVAGGYAVWAIAPMVVRSQVKYHEMVGWTTAGTLEKDPTLNEGTLVNASLDSIGVSRDANGKKTDRLRVASIAVGVGLAAIVALTISVAVHSAQYPPSANPELFDGRSREGQPPAGHPRWPGAAAPGPRLHFPNAGNGPRAEGGPSGGGEAPR